MDQRGDLVGCFTVHQCDETLLLLVKDKVVILIMLFLTTITLACVW